MIVKNGDKFVFTKDCPYCSKSEFTFSGSCQQGGIEVDGVWVDNVGKQQLKEMWNVVKEVGLVKEFEGQEYFYIPAEIPLEINDIYPSDGFGILKINERVSAHFYAYAFVLKEANEDNEEVQIRFIK